MNIKKMTKNIGRSIDEKSPTILTSFGVAGLISTTLLAIKATPRALDLINQAEVRPYKTENELSNLDIIKLVWKCYIPTGISAAITMACIIGANKINLQRNAALISLYSLTEATLREYQEKVIETIGEKKEGKLRDEIAQDRLNDNPIQGKDIYLTGFGEHLVYDKLSGRYFKSDINTIKKVQNNFNEELLTDMYKPVNDFYSELGLEEIEFGRNMGWDIERGLLEIKFISKITTAGEPCIVLDYSVYPKNL